MNRADLTNAAVVFGNLKISNRDHSESVTVAEYNALIDEICAVLKNLSDKVD